VLNTNRMVQPEAEAACNTHGGHLAYYQSLFEQSEVEQQYINAGLLYPNYMPLYWMGLISSPESYPKFRWANNLLPPPNRFQGNYEHWGAYPFGREPDNTTWADYCTVGNQTEAYSLAWGWADTNCSLLAPSICRVDGEARTHAGTAGARRRLRRCPHTCVRHNLTLQAAWPKVP
jgi:hypothetical protein